MNKTERIEKNILADKEILKGINNVSHYELDRFISDGLRYCKAIKEGRVINSIGSVSKSGMSRTVKFLECSKYKNSAGYTYFNFFALFKALGYNPDNNGYSRVNGCGMDMIFHTNYSIIHRLHRLGFINKKQCESLAQKTPHTI